MCYDDFIHSTTRIYPMTANLNQLNFSFDMNQEVSKKKDASHENGMALEKRVQAIFENRGYKVMLHSQWRKMKEIERSLVKTRFGSKILLKNYSYDSDAYTNTGRVEFFDVLGNRAIECKYQEVSGTTCEKIHCTIWRLSQQPFRSIVVYDGEKLVGTEMMESVKRHSEYLLRGIGKPKKYIQVIRFHDFKQMI